MSGRAQRGYDAMAGCYQTLEWLMFGDELQRARTSLLASVGSAKRILVLGDGDGRLLAEICKAAPDATITSVDLSIRMIEQQKSRVAQLGYDHRADWIHADASKADFRVEGSFDWIVMPFFLDCFTLDQLIAAVANWISHLEPNGFLYLVDFETPASGWPRIRGRALLWLMHTFFRLQTGLKNQSLVDWDAVLVQAGMQPCRRCVSGRGMLKTEIWSRASGSNRIGPHEPPAWK